MRRGYRNRWEHDQEPNGGTVTTIPAGMMVVTERVVCIAAGEISLWHHEPLPPRVKKKKVSTAAKLLAEYGWLPGSEFKFK